jgi:hypothetical protein
MAEPFFYQTVVAAMTNPFNSVFMRETGLRELAGLPAGLPPSGFVFHMSRCGSTLISQALAASSGNIVVSEAAPLRAALAFARFDRAQAEAAFRGLVNAFGQPRLPGETRLFIKFMAADVFHLPMIVALFPNTPWIFCHRDPVEILASQAARPGVDLLPGSIGPETPGVPEKPFELDRVEHGAAVLAAMGRAALARAGSDRALFLDYARLPDALWNEVPRHFGFDLDAAGEAALRALSKRDAKNPSRPFDPDGERKRATGADWRKRIDAVAGPVFDALARAG